MEGFEDLALDVDADDYAEAAAGDIPSVNRTYQSEEQFQATKTRYKAKHDAGNSYSDLRAQLDVLTSFSDNGKARLDKKQQLLLGYAVGELYYDKQYEKILQLCQTIQTHCQTDKKLEISLQRWITKCKDKLD